LRSAEDGDLDLVSGLLKNSFGNSVRWQLPAFIRKKYVRALMGEGSKGFIYSEGMVDVGFVLMVYDHDLFISRRQRYEPDLLTKAYLVVRCPRLCFDRLRRFFAPENEKERPLRLFYPEDTLWIDLMAVSVGWQKRGIGTKLVEFCVSTASANGFRHIGVAAEREDLGVNRFYKQNGFVAARVTWGHNIYIRRVDL
jgi:GNAT superfamily N-acetyltransferase